MTQLCFLLRPQWKILLLFLLCMPQFRGGVEATAAAPSPFRCSAAWGLRGGSSAPPEETAPDRTNLSSTILRSALSQIEPLRRAIESGQIVEQLGAKADAIVDAALEQAVDLSTDAVATLEQMIDAPLQVLYYKQLGSIRETVLQQYRAAGKSSYEAMVQADAEFVRRATDAARDGSDDWDYSGERQFLQAVLNLAADATHKTNEVQLQAASQQQTAMAFLQSQQQMIQQLQSQLYGQTSPWNVGVAYRIPDTNFNVQGSYQQGRANVQLSCVPDEYAPFLGPNGFTNGVGPGNLGLSLNLSL
jgi:hypothetical protein